MRNAFIEYWYSPWNWINIFTCFTVLLACGQHLLLRSRPIRDQVLMYALSCASIMALFNCFYFLRGSLKFCVLVSMIQKIVHDIAYLLFMLILVVISFTIAT